VNDSARYIKIVEWSDEDQCFIGQCPGVVGQCCHGDKEAEVYVELCQIVDEWLEILKQEGKPRPPPTVGPRTSVVPLTSDELVLLNNALNEVVNGVCIDEPEFATRLGSSRQTAAGLLHRLADLANEKSIE
jgi:predicted RNase H-like HicB family nuclease